VILTFSLERGRSAVHNVQILLYYELLKFAQRRSFVDSSESV
jgi:hypothetical protein